MFDFLFHFFEFVLELLGGISWGADSSGEPLGVKGLIIILVIVIIIAVATTVVFTLLTGES